MICPKCKESGILSTVTQVGANRTTLVYAPPTFSEQGRETTRDPNTSIADYRCSNGHEWTVKEGWRERHTPGPSGASGEGGE